MAKTKKPGSQINLFKELIRWRDEQRKEQKEAPLVEKGDVFPLESNPMGLYRWYLHPKKKPAASDALLVWVQEIPPGSRSGKLKSQGGQIHYVWEGQGYTIVDGIRHDWEKGDVILIPIKVQGTVYQHFNPDPARRVKLIGAEPNAFEPLGVDRGSGFEVLENSPDYRADS